MNQDLAMTVRMADDAWMEGARSAFRSHMSTALDLVAAGAVLVDQDARYVFAYLCDRFGR